jgi:hypothetical protein
MIDIRRAADAVTQYLEGIGPLVRTAAPRLEEFDYDSQRREWTLTFSFDDLIGVQRIYRTFKVDDDGRVLSMKIRQPAGELS